MLDAPRGPRQSRHLATREADIDAAVPAARDAYDRREWTRAVEVYSAIRDEGTLEADDLERLAVAAYLTGRDQLADEALEASHQAFLDDGRPAAAARCAFWLGMLLFDRGEPAHASGWLGRAHRVLDGQPPGPAHGYLLIPAALQALEAGQPLEARGLFERAAQLADRFEEEDLTALSRLGLGQSMVAAGQASEGLSLLDEIMVSVQAGQVSPIPAGIIYCGVIETCQTAYDLGRAQEWTAALTTWCEEQPDLVPYRGQCLVHRSQILQLRGAWQDALEEADRASERLAERSGGAVGAANYQQGELHRLQGRFATAEEAYRRAGECGAPVQPGLARLRLAQGQLAPARAAIQRALDEEVVPTKRAELLAAHAEVLLASEDIGAARQAADELTRLTEELAVPLLDAVAGHVRGAVLLAEGNASGALGSLRSAWRQWADLGAPYETARVRVLIGLACRAVGDTDGAEMELRAAEAEFERLGAAPELARLAPHLGSEPGRPGGLTDREIEVLRLVAAGKTNRTIADDLVISEHTVARHVQNIFVKLDVSSRTSAAAFAFEHGLI